MAGRSTLLPRCAATRCQHSGTGRGGPCYASGLRRWVSPPYHPPQTAIASMDSETLVTETDTQEGPLHINFVDRLLSLCHLLQTTNASRDAKTHVTETDTGRAFANKLCG